jgi:DNA-binding response OmpR family regulator
MNKDLISSKTPLLKNKTILIVEDDQDIRQTLQLILDDVGYNVFSAEHGKAALELLPTIPKPSLILLDLMMPVMNGLELEKVLSRSDEYSDIPIIVLSAMRGRVQALKSKEFIRKPFNIDELIPKIKKHFCIKDKKDAKTPSH